MPSSLRVASRANPQEADLTRLAARVTSSEIIAGGDVIEVTIAAGLGKDDSVTFPVRIAEDGTGNLPDVGRVQLAGLELDGAEAVIHATCVQRGLYRQPHVAVDMKRQRKNKVRVLGAVKEPGAYDLPRNSSDLLSAIVMAGGLSEDAGEHVEVRNPMLAGGRNPASHIAGAAPNGNPATIQTAGHTNVQTASGAMMKSVRINLISAARDGSSGYVVGDGAVVMVEKRDPAPVHVLGLVEKPAAYEYPVGQDLHVLDAIAMAGGTSNALADKVYVIRPLANSSNPAVIQLRINKAKHSGNSNILLAPGDVVSVEISPGTVFMDAVQFIRFGIGGSIGLF